MTNEKPIRNAADEPVTAESDSETRPHANGSTEGEVFDACKNCGTTAPADAMGLCSNPKCRAVRKGAKLAAKHGPINKKRRAELRHRFTSDYRPATTIDEIRCRELADIAERLEVVKKGTMDHQRLIQTAASLTTSLEESVRMRATQSTDRTLEHLTNEQLIAKLEQMLAAARELQALTLEIDRRRAEDRERLKQIVDAPPAIQQADVQIPLATAAADERKEEHAALRPEFRATQTEDEERAAEIRAEKGWNRGVLNERTGYRLYE